MFEDHGGENKSRAEAEKDRIVYFGVITGLLEERATPRLPPSFHHSPPWIQLHLHTSHLFIISPFSPGLLLLLLPLCLTVSSHLPSAIYHRLSFLILLSTSRLSFPSFSPSFVAPVSLCSFRMMGCCLSGCGKEGCREQTRFSYPELYCK